MTKLRWVTRNESVLRFTPQSWKQKRMRNPLRFLSTALHRALFQDLYDWAGELRTINLSKKGTSFYPADELLQYFEAKFQYLASKHEFRGLSKDVLAESIANFYHEINMLHLFREGNGRTQRLFFTLLIRRCGYHIDFANCDTDELMMATIYAAQGVQTYLTQFFQNAIK